MSEVTQFVIGVEWALGIIIAVVGSALASIISVGAGMFGIYRASANAHCDIRERLTRLEVHLDIEKKDEK